MQGKCGVTGKFITTTATRVGGCGCNCNGTRFDYWYWHVLSALVLLLELHGTSVILAVIIGALVATCNGLNSAQLAANHPVSGGSYEYGYKYLNSWLGFTAGWMFLLAKTASAATAALGFAGYFLNITGMSGHGLLIPVALASVVVLTATVLSGIRRSNVINMTIVSISLLSLVFFIFAGTPTAITNGANNLTPLFPGSIGTVLHASALMFVAYTGYGRIATLGEEAKEPRRTIPRAIVVTIVLTMVLYTAVAVIAVAAVGAEVLGKSGTVGQAAPLSVVAGKFGFTGGVADISNWCDRCYAGDTP